MTINEYAVLAQRTASTKAPKDKIEHGLLGLIGESGEIVDIIKKQRFMGMTDEIAHEKLIDEIGDGLWYVVELCTGLGEDVDSVYRGTDMYKGTCLNIKNDITRLIILVCHALDAYAPDDYIDAFDLSAILYTLMYIAEHFNIDFNEVMLHNIDKLKKRYPDGFSAERSNGRYEHHD